MVWLGLDGTGPTAVSSAQGTVSFTLETPAQDVSFGYVYWTGTSTVNEFHVIRTYLDQDLSTDGVFTLTLPSLAEENQSFELTALYSVYVDMHVWYSRYGAAGWAIASSIALISFARNTGAELTLDAAARTRWRVLTGRIGLAGSALFTFASYGFTGPNTEGAQYTRAG